MKHCMNAESKVCPKCQRDIAADLAAGATKCTGCGQAINASPGGTREPAMTRMQALQLLLIVDAAVLFLLGALLILAPKQVELAFKFKDLPAGVSYIIGMWGCVLATMGIGYAVAATNPIRHVVWVQVGIARGALECALGLVSLSRGIVTWQQAGFGIAVAALITVAYFVLYPRGPRLVNAPATSTQAPDRSP